MGDSLEQDYISLGDKNLHYTGVFKLFQVHRCFGSMECMDVYGEKVMHLEPFQNWLYEFSICLFMNLFQ